jgi:dynein heavy chain
MYKMLGNENKKLVFNLADKDITQEQFIEDINNILNVGELPSLFGPEDHEEINDEIERQLKQAKVKDTTMENCQRVFKRRCKKNLHLLLYFSPAGNRM